MKTPDAFPVAVPLPAWDTFRSTDPGTSPMGVFEAWVQKRLRDPEITINDIMLTPRDMDGLRKVARSFLRETMRFKGRDLVQALFWLDTGSGPLVVRRRRNVPSGFVYVRAYASRCMRRPVAA